MKNPKLKEKNYQIVDRLDSRILTSSDKSVYTTTEQKYLTRFNPFAFREISSVAGHTLNNESLEQSARIAIFSLIATIDAAVAYGSVNYEYVEEEKLPFLNPYLSALELEQIEHTQDPILSAWKMRMKGLEALKKVSNLELELDDNTYFIQNKDRFSEVARRFSQNIDNSLTLVVYGSAINSETPRDIDVLVLQDEKDFALYREIMDWVIKDDYKPKISPQIIPKSLLPYFLATDPYDMLVPGYSEVIGDNESLEVVVVSEAQRSEMCKYKVGYQLMRSREALTNRFFDFYANSENKVRSELKQARFAARNLKRAFGIEIRDFPISPWSKKEGRDKLRKRLAELNLQLSKQIDQLNEEGFL